MVPTEPKSEKSTDIAIQKMKEDFNKITFFKVKSDIFFHGNEVAKYLEYINYSSAIYKIVNNEDKVTFHFLKSVLGQSLMEGVQFQPETYFINQDGLLDLILKSRMPLALQFRKWLYREVIPCILNTGAYVSPHLFEQLKKENTELQVKLSAANTNPYMNKVQRNRLENAEYKMEQVYIITSKEYARNYIFKIGKSVDSFKRLPSLNTGNINDSDQLYVCYVHNCLESIHVEKHIHTMLQSYRYKNNREFFVINFHVLKNLIDRCCTRNNLNFEDFMEDIKEDNKLIASEFSDFIPEPVNVNLIALPEKKSNQITNYFSHV
jgi:prophage antirepressor-like protein